MQNYGKFIPMSNNRGMSIVPQKIKRARQQAGLTQGELADRAGLSQAYLSQIESGSKDPSVETLQKLANTLGIEPGSLFASTREGGKGGYAGPDRLLNDSQTPQGLRELATDQALCQTLAIAAWEWEALASLRLPGPISRDSYISILCAIRAAIGTPNRVTKT